MTSCVSKRVRAERPIHCATNLRTPLCEQGFGLLRGPELRIAPAVLSALDQLERECEQLPLDRYCAAANRYRRHSRFTVLPWVQYLAPRPVSHYCQDQTLNPEHGGMVRKFDPLTRRMLRNQFLHELVLFDLACLSFSDEDLMGPIDVGVHVIKTVARPGQPGVSSPNCLHKDGEPFTFIHLLQRRNVIGGESVVADNDKRPLLDVTLVDRMDTLVVRDESVYHQVKEIYTAPSVREGHRTVLLIDFTAMKPDVKLPA